MLQWGQARQMACRGCMAGKRGLWSGVGCEGARRVTEGGLEGGGVPLRKHLKDQKQKDLAGLWVGVKVST